MYPQLFSIGPVTIHSFGVMMSLAFITAGVTAAWQLKKRGIDPELAYSLLIAAIVGGVVGAKVHYLIANPDQARASMFSGSGLIWYGGLFGGALAVWVVAYFSKPRTALLADAIAPGLAAAYAVGRVGCLLNGDDYGVPTTLPWGLSFPKGTPPTEAVVHPTQIYESLMSLIILGLLLWVAAPRLRRAGSLFWVYLALAGIERFLVEFVRTNESVALGLTQAQWISVLLLAAGVAGVWWLESHRGSGVPALGATGAAMVGSKKGRPGGGAAKPRSTKKPHHKAKAAQSRRR
ncbi:MAG: prolipoprotein diacylglyceryl transferase [Thermoleophilia bacterium]